MSITDELREWFKDRFFMANGWQEIHDIADRIDAEHERAMADAYLSGTPTDEQMAEHGWVRKSKEHVVSHATIEVTPHIDWSRMADELNEFVEIVRGNGLKLRRTQMQFTDEQQRFIDEHYQLLPKDADGEYIHVGDVMEWVRYKDGDPTIVRTVSGIGNGVFFAWSDEQGRYAQYEAHAYRHHHTPTVEDVLTEFGIDWEHESDCEDRAALLKEYASKLRLAEGED